MKKVSIYMPGKLSGYAWEIYQVGKDGVSDIHFHNRAVKIEYENGDHRFISGFPFEFVSPKPLPMSDKELCG